MQTYELLVQNRAVKANSTDTTLVRTSIGIDEVHVYFDSDEWLEFPVTVTFAQGDDVLVTTSLTVSEIEDSDEWVAEATVTVPYEVIEATGAIRVTFQGTDSNGRHIITAKGSPLSVEEAGDVDEGSMPSDAPTVDQWTQAYADAMEVINEAASLVSNFESNLNTMVTEVQEGLEAQVEEVYVPATTSSLGVIQVGNGLTIDANGILAAEETNGITSDQVLQIVNLASLAYYCFDTTFDDDGILEEGAMVKYTALPIDGATMLADEDDAVIYAATATTSSLGVVRPDGDTVTIDNDGVISATEYELPAATTSTLGGVMVDGTTITVDDDGVISGVEQYELPVATESTLGGVMVDGTTITVDESGVISGTAEVDVATTSTAGVVIPDGETITVDGDGTIHGVEQYELPSATTSTLGGVMVSTAHGLTISDGTLGSRAATSSAYGTVKYDNSTIGMNSEGQLYVINDVSELVSSMAAQIATLQEQVNELMEAQGTTLSASVSSNYLNLTGSDATVADDELTITSTDASVTDDVLDL